MATSGAVIARIISQYSDKGSKAAQKDIAKMGKKIDDWSKRTVKAYGVAAAAVGVFAYQVGKNAVQGAMEDQKQQASLATALRNTTGATDAAIQANQEYLDGLELQVAIDNNQLIPALQKLVMATGDLGQAQALLSLATDVSAASGKDLASVSTALSRAVNGNFTALTRLGIPLDAAAVKSGDLEALLADLAKTSKGQAEAAANTFAGRMEKLRLQFAQTADKLGYALIPVIEEFATYIASDVIPNIEEWVELNETKLRDSFKGVIDTLLALSINLVKIIGFLEKYKEILIVLASIPLVSVFGNQIAIIVGLSRAVYKGLGAIPVATGKVAGAFRGFAAAVSLVAGAFRAGGFLAAVKGAISLFMQLNPYVRIATIAIGALYAGYKLFKKLFSDTDSTVKKATRTNEEIAKQQKESILNGFKSIEVATEAANAEKARTLETIKNLQAQKKADAAAKARAKIEADTLKKQAALKKTLGAKGSNRLDEETDQVQLNAAIALQKRQENAKKADMEKLELLKSLFKTQDDLARLELVRSDILAEYNKNLRYQNDLMVEYQDDLKITADEIKTLAIRWGISAEEVEKYSTVFLALVDEKIDSTDIKNVATAFNIAETEAKKYLQAVLSIKHGTLDAQALQRLADEWKIPVNEALKYIHSVALINNPTAKLSAAGIDSLKSTWGMTNAELLKYLEQIALPFDYDASMLDGVDSLLSKLKEALALIKQIQGGTSTAATAATKKTDTSGLGGSKTDSAASSEIQKQIDVLKELKKDAPSGTIAGFKIKEQIDELTDNLKNGTKAAATIVDEQNKRAGQIASAQAAQAASPSFNVGAFRLADKESMSSFVSPTDYDERFRFSGMDLRSPTMETAASSGFKGLQGSSGNTEINLTVNGNIQTENDIIQAIRTGLLAAQQNGQGLTLQAI